MHPKIGGYDFFKDGDGHAMDSGSLPEPEGEPLTVHWPTDPDEPGVTISGPIESTAPVGFVEVPEGLSEPEIKELQQAWDSATKDDATPQFKTRPNPGMPYGIEVRPHSEPWPEEAEQQAEPDAGLHLVTEADIRQAAGLPFPRYLPPNEHLSVGRPTPVIAISTGDNPAERTIYDALRAEDSFPDPAAPRWRSRPRCAVRPTMPDAPDLEALRRDALALKADQQRVSEDRRQVTRAARGVGRSAGQLTDDVNRRDALPRDFMDDYAKFKGKIRRPVPSLREFTTEELGGAKARYRVEPVPDRVAERIHAHLAEYGPMSPAALTEVTDRIVAEVKAESRVRIVHRGGPARLAEVYIDGKLAPNVNRALIRLAADDNRPAAVWVKFEDVDIDVSGDLTGPEPETYEAPDPTLIALGGGAVVSVAAYVAWWLHSGSGWSAVGCWAAATLGAVWLLGTAFATASAIRQARDDAEGDDQ